MKTPWHWADELSGKEKPEIKEVVEDIQNEAYNQAIEDVLEYALPTRITIMKSHAVDVTVSLELHRIQILKLKK